MNGGQTITIKGENNEDYNKSKNKNLYFFNNSKTVNSMELGLNKTNFKVLK